MWREEEEEGEVLGLLLESILQAKSPHARSIKERWDNCRKQALTVLRIDIGDFDYNPTGCLHRIISQKNIPDLQRAWLLVFFYGEAQKDPDCSRYILYIKDVVSDLQKQDVYVGHHIGIFQPKTTPFLDSIRPNMVINVSNIDTKPTQGVW